MKYRRLLPMIVNDEHDQSSIFDDFADFAVSDPAFAASGLALPFTARPGSPLLGGERANADDRKVCVSNVSSRATKSQLQSFFSKFGKVISCQIPMDKTRRETMAIIPPKQQTRKWHGICVIKFKSIQSAMNVKKARPEELIFYGQQLTVGPYISSGSGIARRRTNSQQLSPRTQDNEQADIGEVKGMPFSRTSSTSSLASTATNCSNLTISATTPLSGLNLAELPERALVILLHFIGPIERIRLERVCKRWLEASAKAWLFTRHISFGEDPDLSLFFSSNRSLRQPHLNAILRRCGIHLSALSLAGVNNLLLDDQALSELLGTFCPNLIELDLSGVSASPEVLRSLGASFPILRSIAYRDMANTSERAFWYLFKSVASQIRAVDLRGCVRLRGLFFKLFSTELEEILLDGCRLIEDQLIEDLCDRCPCLHKLKLDGCNRLTDESLSLISRHLSELRTLTMCGEFPNLTSDAMAMHIHHISSLLSLSLDYNSCVDDKLIESLSKGMPNLKELSLAFAGTDTSFSPEGVKQLAKLNKLEMINLSGIAAVDNSVMKEISRGCVNLKRIILRSCSYLGPDGVVEIQNLKQLEHIDLSGCILVTNNCVQELCNSFTKQNGEVKTEQMINLVIGGTFCEPHRLRVPPSSLIVLDNSDNSALTGIFGENWRQPVDDDWEAEGGDDDDDEFRLLSAHRTFIADALRTEDEPLVFNDEQAAVEWARQEAAKLGLAPPNQ